MQLQGQALLKKRLLEQADDPVPLVNQVLQKYCFGQPNPTLTREMLADAKKYANREMSETDYWDLKEKYDEKTLLNLFFEGSVHLQQMTEQAFGDVRMENRMIKIGGRYITAIQQAGFWAARGSAGWWGTMRGRYIIAIPQGASVGTQTPGDL